MKGLLSPEQIRTKFMEGMYASLIASYAKNGDLDGAERALRDAELNLGWATTSMYSAVMWGYAIAFLKRPFVAQKAKKAGSLSARSLAESSHVAAEHDQKPLLASHISSPKFKFILAPKIPARGKREL